MKYRLYYIEDSYLADLIWEDEFREFCDVMQNLDDDWNEKTFDTEREMECFVFGLSQMKDERDIRRYAILRSNDPDHARYIDYIRGL